MCLHFESGLFLGRKTLSGCKYTYRHGMYEGHECGETPVSKDGLCFFHTKMPKRLDSQAKLPRLLEDRVAKRVSLEGIQLPNADLRNVHLAGANLQDANFQGCNFQQARLAGADLTGADLRGATLAGVNLRQATLKNANFAKASIVEGNLTAADLSGANLQGATMEGVILTEGNCERMTAQEANFFGANLERVNFRQANLSDANVECANLSGADFYNSVLSDLVFNALTITTGVANIDDAIGVPDEWRAYHDMLIGPSRRRQRPIGGGQVTTSRPVSHLLPNDFFGDHQEYKILRRLGKGGSAFVYLIEDLVDREVPIKALKILDPHLGTEEVNVKRFRREGLIGKNVQHPRVIRIYDVKYTKQFDTFYLLMEYIEGYDLKKLLGQYNDGKRVFPAKMGINILFQICQGLEAAHAANIVHRDLKPANVLIKKDGKIVLTDFGLSKINNSLETTLHLTTMPGTLLGTFEYMSPEQVVGQEVTHLTDIYSLGVIMYEIFVGQAPYKAHNVLAWVNVIRNKKAVPPSKMNPKFPEWLENIILKCLEKDPAKRFQSVSEIIQALKNKGQ